MSEGQAFFMAFSDMSIGRRLNRARFRRFSQDKMITLYILKNSRIAQMGCLITHLGERVH